MTMWPYASHQHKPKYILAFPWCLSVANWTLQWHQSGHFILSNSDAEFCSTGSTTYQRQMSHGICSHVLLARSQFYWPSECNINQHILFCFHLQPFGRFWVSSQSSCSSSVKCMDVSALIFLSCINVLW